MSFASITTAASIRSQGYLAQIQGMAATASGNFLYNGEAGAGVFGSAQVVEIPQLMGGYRRRAELTLTVTREQDFTFEAKTKLVRLATGTMPSITYVIDRIDPHDPLVWTLTLVKFGEVAR